MPVMLRCPGCGKVYRLPDARAGKRAQCPCGAVMQVAALETEPGNRAWEDEVNRAFGPSPASEPQDKEPKGLIPSPREPPKEIVPTTPMHAEPPAPADAPPGQKRAGDAPLPPLLRVARFFKTDLRGLMKKDPWRTVIGLAGVAYGVVAATAFVYAIALEPGVGLLFGRTAYRIAQAALAVGMAVGGVLILKEDKTGPACAGLAALLFCLFPMWGLLPELLDALRSEQFLPLLWLAARYAVPIALMVWCLRDQTRRESEKER